MFSRNWSLMLLRGKAFRAALGESIGFSQRNGVCEGIGSVSSSAIYNSHDWKDFNGNAGV